VVCAADALPDYDWRGVVRARAAMRGRLLRMAPLQPLRSGGVR